MAAGGFKPNGSAVHWRASLRTQLMLWFGTLLAALILLGFAAAYYVAQRQLVVEGQARTRFEARQAGERLEAAMESVRITADGLAKLYPRLGLEREGLVRALDAMLEADASAVGGLVAMEPGVLGDAQPLAYYVGVDSRGAADRDLLADGYDVRSQAWYQRTLAEREPWWSTPYFNETAGGTWMVTLNHPVMAGDGRVIGMVNLDVPVRRLSELLDSLRAVPGQRPSLIAPDGTLVVHPDPGVALHHTLRSYIAQSGRTDLAPLEAAHAAQQPFEMMHTVPETDERRFSVLTPIGESGWSLHLALAEEALLTDLQHRVAWLTAAGLLMALVFAGLVRRLARRITVPLSELTGSAGHFALGEYDWPVPHDTRGDEVGVMARALERARDSIRFQMGEIADMAGERQKLESELDIARDIQLAMLPGGRVLQAGAASVEAWAVLQPAKAVGGDFYNFFEQDGGVLWFVIGDVSDKGVPAALFMARTMTVLEVAATLGGSPDRALAEAARHLVEGNDTCMFATALCGKLDLATGALVMANAGHEAPLRISADGQVAMLPVVPAAPLGFEVAEAYPCWQGQLAPGDTLLMYTDGVSEAFDVENQAFGEARLQAALAPGRDARAQCEALVDAVHTFAGAAPQSDDITVLALHYLHAGATDHRWRLASPDEMLQLPGLLSEVDAALRAAGLSTEVSHDVQLMLEELVCNAVDYGTLPDLPLDIQVQLALAPGQATLEFRDQGQPYNPLEQPAPDLDADIADRPIGGLGVHLIRELAESVHYLREEPCNILRIALRTLP
jgi:sigma-B regulation protein RsbU (phosphoserine phosphatase)